MDGIDLIAQHMADQPDKPPLHMWNPKLSGDIDIVIKANGEWFHEGGEIKRPPLVKLFSSILRRENDDQYYLVTPVEKWRISVEDSAFLITTMDVINVSKDSQQIIFTTNVDDKFLLSTAYPLIIDIDDLTGEPDPKIKLNNNLTAKLSRNVFYQLVDYAVADNESYYVLSDGEQFGLGRV